MRVLFTGSSSFTGAWFIRQLVEAGHDVVATFGQPVESYHGIRKQRVQGVTALCESVFACEFGAGAFLAVVSSRNWDLFAHHAADVTNYRSPDFDVVRAVASNTQNLRAVLRALAERECGRAILTGSVFEQDEGAGDEPRVAFSPYGLSKGLTWQFWRYYAAEAGLALGKFVIPNPFGPLEEPRFTSYLARTWFAGEMARVATPAYVRDNIPVDLLARAYAAFGAAPARPGAVEFLHPSGYVGRQGWFATLVATEMRARLGLPCELELANQSDFSEPRVRINTDPLDYARLGWDEDASWDALAAHYRAEFGPPAGGPG